MSAAPFTNSEETFHYWNNFPSDIKRVVILKLDLKTRRALRRCSKDDKALVEQYPMRCIFRVFCDSRISSALWRVGFECSSRCNSPNHLSEDLTADDAYTRLREKLRDVDYVEHMVIDIYESDHPLKLRDDGKLLKARTLAVHSQSHPDGLIPFLKQFDMNYMRAFYFLDGEVSDELFSMLKVEYICVPNSRISDERLLNLCCTDVKVDSSDLTLAGLIRFVAKIIRKLDKHNEAWLTDVSDAILEEIFGVDEEMQPRIPIYLDSPFPEYKLELLVQPPRGFRGATMFLTRRDAVRIRSEPVENPSIKRFISSVNNSNF